MRHLTEREKTRVFNSMQGLKRCAGCGYSSSANEKERIHLQGEDGNGLVLDVPLCSTCSHTLKRLTGCDGASHEFEKV
jgi:hypothetical protein